MNRNKPTIAAALAFAFVVPAFGYIYLGKLVAFTFLLGYLCGFALWILTSRKVQYSSIQTPFWTTFAAFLLLHKVEENKMQFFETLADTITGVAVPQVTLPLTIGLVAIPIGSWLLVPFLVKRSHDFGYYLAWTFFASMGLTELAHFIFPLLWQQPYGYFPGMASAAILAPLAWWGMWKLSGRSFKKARKP